VLMYLSATRCDLFKLQAWVKMYGKRRGIKRDTNENLGSSTGDVTLSFRTAREVAFGRVQILGARVVLILRWKENRGQGRATEY